MEVSEVQGRRAGGSRTASTSSRPPQDMVLADGMLKLVPRSSNGRRAHADRFLPAGRWPTCRAARRIGVILSGMGSDGTLGLQAIEAEGGIALRPGAAHRPRTTTCRAAPSPPDGVDFVLTPEEIARELTRLGQHPYLAAAEAAGPPRTLRGAQETTRKTIRRPGQDPRRCCGRPAAPTSAPTRRRRCGRRIARRMAVSRIETLDEYARHLEGDAAEAEALYEDCLISVTSFFRDPQVFQALSEQVLPASCSRTGPPTRPSGCGCPAARPAKRCTRSPCACWSGAAELSRNPSLQIFATDLSESALAKARDGHVPREHRPGRLPRAPAALLRQGGRPLPDQQGHPRDVRLRPPRPDPRPAVLAHRPHQLPQRPHLPGASAAGEGVRDLPLRAAPRGLPGPRAGGDASAPPRRCSPPSTRSTGSTRRKAAAGPPRLHSVPRDAGRRRGRRRRTLLTPKAAARLGGARGKRTGCCWPGSGPPASWSTRASTSSSSAATRTRSSSTATARPA